MNNLVDKINETYLDRCVSPALQREIWHDLASFFKPDIKNYRLNRPSAIIAGITGDLGLAVLWIVQAALTRPVIKDLVMSAPQESSFISLVSGIDDFSICALAHSEDKSSPVTVKEEGDSIILNGVKKFITAGVNADYILITCRDENEEKINRAVMLNRESIDTTEMKDLHLPVMKSVNHTSLNFSNRIISAASIPPVNGSELRRAIKKWSIIERALITEAFIPFLGYFNKAALQKRLNIADENTINTLSQEQSALASTQIEEAFFAEKISTGNIEMNKLFELISLFREKRDEITSILDEKDKLKFSDVFLFDSLK